MELNEHELWREMVRHAYGAIVEEPGALLLVGPVASMCAAFRLDAGVGADAFLDHCQSFFDERGLAFSIAARLPQDADLVQVCAARGFAEGWIEHTMVLTASPDQAPLPKGFELHRARTPDDVERFRDVVVAANDEPERERGRLVFAAPGSILASNVVAFLALDDHGPVSTAMTMVSHGVAGVFWVATTERARRRGLAGALTREAARAGLAMGADAAWLGASEQGAGVYERIGFECIGTYVELDSPR